MIVNFAGTGNLTRFFAKVLPENFTIRFLISRDRRKAEKLAKWLGKGCGVSYDDSFTLEGTIFVLVPDRHVKEVYERLKEKTKGKVVFVHASGYLPSTIFDDADEKGWGRASFHPNFSFSDVTSGRGGVVLLKSKLFK